MTVTCDFVNTVTKVNPRVKFSYCRCNFLTRGAARVDGRRRTGFAVSVHGRSAGGPAAEVSRRHRLSNRGEVGPQRRAAGGEGRRSNRRLRLQPEKQSVKEEVASVDSGGVRVMAVLANPCLFLRVVVGLTFHSVLMDHHFSTISSC